MEKNQLKDFILRIIACLIFAVLYSAGGSEEFQGLWLRRYLAPTLLSGALFYFTLDWRYLVGLPMCFGSLSLGYGSDYEIFKIIKRGLFGIANDISFSVGNLLNKKYGVSIFHILSLPVASIYFGVYNPFPNAMIEQGVIGFLICFVPVMAAKRKN